MNARAGTAKCHALCSEMGEALGIHNVACPEFARQERESWEAIRGNLRAMMDSETAQSVETRLRRISYR